MSHFPLKMRIQGKFERFKTTFLQGSFRPRKMLAKIGHIYYNICVIPKVEKFCFFVGDFWNFGGIYVYETDA